MKHSKEHAIMALLNIAKHFNKMRVSGKSHPSMEPGAADEAESIEAEHPTEEGDGPDGELSIIDVLKGHGKDEGDAADSGDEFKDHIFPARGFKPKMREQHLEAVAKKKHGY